MKEKANQLVARAKTVSDFFSDALEAFKDFSPLKNEGFQKAVEGVIPWADYLTEGIPIAKFVVKIAEQLTKETDPEKLGMIALTFAYQEAVRIALKNVSGAEPVPDKMALGEAKKQFQTLKKFEEIDVSTFSLKEPFRHEFIGVANQHFEVVARSVGYNNEQVEELLEDAKRNFADNLVKLLSNGETKDKFAPFEKYLELGAEQRRAYKSLAAHANYQRWLYEEAPVLGRSPFALKHVYIETECGKLRWEEINRDYRSNQEKVDPFNEKHGGRQPLIKTVVDLIKSKELKDEAIIIQGVAGAGKSSFTLKLCDELLKLKLHPIRVRIRDMRFDVHVKDAIPKAVTFGDDIYPAPRFASTDNLFQNDAIYDERGVGDFEHISKYVLILDGWDEISYGADESFQRRVSKMLDQIYENYLRESNPRIRVILTGRPSSDIGNNNCLRESTPILTARPMRPEQLKEYVESLADAVNAKTPPVKCPDEDNWKIPDLKRFEPVFVKYEEAFKKLTEKPESSRQEKLSDTLDVLSLPLLALLAVRLIAEWKGDPTELIENPTTLYRHLVDLTCKKAGKAEIESEGSNKQFKFMGDELRQLLHRTASAITVCGTENISQKELSARLDLDEGELDEQTQRLTKEQKLSHLLISFYFKGGHANLGCEFLHKSFREYLFAEAVVETLKEYGRSQKETPLVREPYWKDFDASNSDDNRYELSRNLSELLAPQWLTAELKKHLEHLIHWEIERIVKGSAEKTLGSQTEMLDWQGWKQIRIALADLWDWWTESVHLRPQTIKKRRGYDEEFEYPYVNELIKWAAPIDRAVKGDGYESSASLDAHLGEGLFLLCNFVHGLMAEYEQEELINVSNEIRRYQNIIPLKFLDNKLRILFEPSQSDVSTFSRCIDRINSVERFFFYFPVNERLLYLNFSYSDLSYLILNRASLFCINFSDASMDEVQLNYASLDYADFSSANLNYSNFKFATLTMAKFNGAFLRGASFYQATLLRVDFSEANLTNAVLTRANLTDCIFDDAQLEDAFILSYQISADLLGKAKFEFIYLDNERTDRETALAKLKEIQMAEIKEPEDLYEE